jgi:hypothetical protein
MHAPAHSERGHQSVQPPAAPLPSRYLTTTEAAAYLRYRGASGIRMAVRRGWLRPAARRGRVLLFRLQDLEHLLGTVMLPVPPVRQVRRAMDALQSALGQALDRRQLR